MVVGRSNTTVPNHETNRLSKPLEAIVFGVSVFDRFVSGLFVWSDLGVKIIASALNEMSGYISLLTLR